MSSRWLVVVRCIILLGLVLMLVLTASAPVARAASIIRVMPTGTSTWPCGSTWATACAYLQTAVTNAASGDEIWVAAGVHKPTYGTDRTATFQLKSNLALYGGFAGTETLRTQRNPAANVTILSGDIDSNDVNTDGNEIAETTADIVGSNAYHVVTGANGATLDGVIVSGGYADSGTNCPSDACGGGLYNFQTSPTVNNVTFIGNYASKSGGGMANVSFGVDNQSNPVVTNVTFANNTAGYSGGGMFNYLNSPILTNLTFKSNAASVGGAIENYYANSPVLTNVTFNGNSAYFGGAIYNIDSATIVRNSILWGNGTFDVHAQSTWGMILENSIMATACPVTATCTNLNTADPLLGTYGDYGGNVPTIPLLPGSPALYATTSNCPTTDARGITRSSPCDYGAFESQGFILWKTGGDNQTTGTSAPFAQPLALTVMNTHGEPVNGGVVTFVGPLTGASTNPVTNTAVIASGAVSKTVYANNVSGTYNVNALTGASIATAFTLRNDSLYNVNLSNLTLSTGTLNPGFVPTTTSYTTTVRAPKISVTPTTVDPTATVKVNGTSVASGSASGEIPLNIGASTTITIVVTGPDGFANKTYTLTVTQDCTGYTVTSNADDGAGSLRYGLASVCANATISFSNDYTITLASQLVVNKSLTITGAGHHITLDGNHAVRIFEISGGNSTFDSLNLINGQVSDQGGAMQIEVSTGVTILNSTFSGNYGTYAGGAIYSLANSLIINNSTFANNSSRDHSGALAAVAGYGCGTTTLTNNTFSGNTSGGPDGTIGSIYCATTLKNNIVKTSGGTACSGIGGGTFIDGGGNLKWGDTSCPGISANPALGALGDYGGATPTLALGADSAAIDAAVTANCPSTDQRGQPRNDLHCDSGAYELKYPDSPTVIRSISSTITTTFGPALLSLQRDAAFTDPGVMTVTKEAWSRPGAESINVLWAITPTVTSGFSLTLQVCITPTDRHGLAEGSLFFYRSDGITYTKISTAPTWSTVNTYRCAALSGITQLSRWTLATDTPTAVTLNDLLASSNPIGGAWPIGLLLAALLVLSGGVWLKRRLRSR